MDVMKNGIRNLRAGVFGLLAVAVVSLASAHEVVTGKAGRLGVTFLRDDVIHFRFAPPDATLNFDSALAAKCEMVAKRDEDYALVKQMRTDEAARVTVTGPSLAVTVDRDTLAFKIVGADGKPLFASTDRPFTAEGPARRLSLQRDVAGTEHFFGLGNVRGKNFTTLDHRGTVYDLWLHDDNVHAIVPLWYSSSGYGVYVCNSHRGRVSFKEDYGIALDGGEMDFYFFWGPAFKTILMRWSELAGRMHLPPRSALGLTYRGWGNATAADVEKIVVEQLENGIKIDTAGAEPGWHTRAYPCSYVWSGKFPDPKGFVSRLHAHGVKVNLWEHPYVSPASPIIKAIEPYGLWGGKIGSRQWENGSRHKYGFGGFVPDMTLEAARDIYWRHHRDAIVSLGVDGFKVDETDSFSANASLDLYFPGGLSCNAYHNLLGTLTVNFLHARYRRDFNRRSFMYSRGNYAGMQRWATAAYTDFYGFPQFVMSLIAQSYSGTYYTPEIRDVSTPSDVDYMRRAQMMFLTPFAQADEWQKPTCVLRRSAAVVACYREYNALHYALIPYLYSLFREQNETGVGVLRALGLEFPSDPKTQGIADAFMLGPSLLVHPVASLEPTAAVEVYLPAGEEWMDYREGKVYPGGQTIVYTCDAKTLPLFVRVGAVIPLGHYGKNTSEVVDPTFTLAVFPPRRAHTASFTAYEDDGISFDYEKGVFAETPVTVKTDADRIDIRLAARRGTYKVGPRACELKVHVTTAPQAVQLDGRPLAAADSLATLANCGGWFFDAHERAFETTVRIRFPDDGKPHTISLAGTRHK